MESFKQRSVVWTEKTYCESLRVYSSGVEQCANTVAPLGCLRTSGSSSCFLWTFTPPRVFMSISFGWNQNCGRTGRQKGFGGHSTASLRSDVVLSGRPSFCFFTQPFLSFWKCVSVEGMSTSWLFELWKLTPRTSCINLMETRRFRC